MTAAAVFPSTSRELLPDERILTLGSNTLGGLTTWNCSTQRQPVQHMYTVKQHSPDEQHRNSFPLPSRQNDRKSWQEYEELCLKTRKTAAKRKDNITKELKWQSSAAARQRIQQQCPTKQKQMNKQFFGEATDKKQLTCVLNKETGEMLNDPDAVLEYVQSSFQEQAKPASGCAKKRTSHQTTETESILGNMVHTAVLTPSR